MKKRRRREFNNRKREQRSGCTACEWIFCHFGCQHYRSSAGANYLCDAYREFVRYTGQRFQALAREVGRGCFQ